MFLKREASHSTLFNLDPSSEKEGKKSIKELKLKSFVFLSAKVVEGLLTIQ